jgi:hypothetical protein
MNIGRAGNLLKICPLLIAAAILSACNEQATSDSTAATSAETGAETSRATSVETLELLRHRRGNTAGPTISGTAPTSVVAGAAYSFLPSSTDPGGATLGFSIANKPSWATFSTTTGLLAGTPTDSNVGTTSNIVITVSDERGSASLASFSIAVTQPAPVTGTVTLSWTAPTENTNGSAISDLTGYTIFYGTNSASMTQTVNVPGAGSTSYVIGNLSAGTYYFAVAANASDGTQSAKSPIGSKTF